MIAAFVTYMTAGAFPLWNGPWLAAFVTWLAGTYFCGALAGYAMTRWGPSK